MFPELGFESALVSETFNSDGTSIAEYEVANTKKMIRRNRLWGISHEAFGRIERPYYRQCRLSALLVDKGARTFAMDACVALPSPLPSDSRRSTSCDMYHTILNSGLLAFEKPSRARAKLNRHLGFLHTSSFDWTFSPDMSTHLQTTSCLAPLNGPPTVHNSNSSGNVNQEASYSSGMKGDLADDKESHCDISAYDGAVCDAASAFQCRKQLSGCHGCLVDWFHLSIAELQAAEVLKFMTMGNRFKHKPFVWAPAVFDHTLEDSSKTMRCNRLNAANILQEVERQLNLVSPRRIQSFEAELNFVATSLVIDELRSDLWKRFYGTNVVGGDVSPHGFDIGHIETLTSGVVGGHQEHNRVPHLILPYVIHKRLDQELRFGKFLNVRLVDGSYVLSMKPLAAAESLDPKTAWLENDDATCSSTGCPAVHLSPQSNTSDDAMTGQNMARTLKESELGYIDGQVLTDVLVLIKLQQSSGVFKPTRTGALRSLIHSGGIGAGNSSDSSGGGGPDDGRGSKSRESIHCTGLWGGGDDWSNEIDIPCFSQSVSVEIFTARDLKLSEVRGLGRYKPIASFSSRPSPMSLHRSHHKSSRGSDERRVQRQAQLETLQIVIKRGLFDATHRVNQRLLLQEVEETAMGSPLILKGGACNAKHASSTSLLTPSAENADGFRSIPFPDNSSWSLSQRRMSYFHCMSFSSPATDLRPRMYHHPPHDTREVAPSDESDSIQAAAEKKDSPFISGASSLDLPSSTPPAGGAPSPQEHAVERQIIPCVTSTAALISRRPISPTVCGALTCCVPPFF